MKIAFLKLSSVLRTTTHIMTNINGWCHGSGFLSYFCNSTIVSGNVKQPGNMMSEHRGTTHCNLHESTLSKTNAKEKLGILMCLIVQLASLGNLCLHQTCLNDSTFPRTCNWTVTGQKAGIQALLM